MINENYCEKVNFKVKGKTIILEFADKFNRYKRSSSSYTSYFDNLIDFWIKSGIF